MDRARLGWPTALSRFLEIPNKQERHMIKVGDRLPEASFRVKGDDGTVKQVPSSEIFGGQKVVLVGVPGAFTSTCHNAHIPTFVANIDQIKSRGVDRIAVMA